MITRRTKGSLPLSGSYLCWTGKPGRKARSDSNSGKLELTLTHTRAHALRTGLKVDSLIGAGGLVSESRGWGEGPAFSSGIGRSWQPGGTSPNSCRGQREVREVRGGEESCSRAEEPASKVTDTRLLPRRLHLLSTSELGLSRGKSVLQIRTIDRKTQVSKACRDEVNNFNDIKFPSRRTSPA